MRYLLTAIADGSFKERAIDSRRSPIVTAKQTSQRPRCNDPVRSIGSDRIRSTSHCSSTWAS